MIINLLKLPLLTNLLTFPLIKCHLNRIIKFLKLLHHLTMSTNHLLKVVVIKVAVAIKVVAVAVAVAVAIKAVIKVVVIKAMIKVVVIKVVAVIKVVVVKAVIKVAVVVDHTAITATGVNGASARKTAALVPKPTLAQLLDHPPNNVPTLRSHSHAILMLAPTAVNQPLQPICL